jgi:Icc-related predicted phosphoesterase
MKQLKCTAISDTHCKFPLDLPGGDLLVHAGDFTYRGRESEVKPFLSWYNEQLAIYTNVVFIAGNHERTFEANPGAVKEWLSPYLSDRFIYLEHQSVTIDGFNIFGFPSTPSFGYGWAFNVDRGNMHTYLDAVPSDTDLLISHGPPHGYGDYIEERVWGRNDLGQESWETLFRHKGCEEMLEALKRISPQYHVFGHFHAAYGKYIGKEDAGIPDVVMLNAALCGEDYQLSRKPHNFVLTK